VIIHAEQINIKCHLLDLQPEKFPQARFTRCLSSCQQINKKGSKSAMKYACSELILSVSLSVREVLVVGCDKCRSKFPLRLWALPSLLSNGYRGLFPRGQSGRDVKLTTHLLLVPRSRMRGAVPPFSNTGTTLPLPFYIQRLTVN